MENRKIKGIIRHILCILLVVTFATSGFCVSLEEMDLSNGNPYYKLWNNNFITYIDNYKGDISNVSINDLKAGNGTSRIYTFSKLTNSTYSYDKLLEDIKNENNLTNLHDAKPILMHLPKTAKNCESHALFSSNDEKGKLFSGGPYSKYSDKENGFYYKDELIDKNKVNKLLKEYADKVKVIDKRIRNLKTFSLSDIYKDAKVAYMTNGAVATIGADGAVIYELDIKKKYSPFGLDVKALKESNIKKFKNNETVGKLPDWEMETIYLFSDDGKTLIKKITINDFVSELWAKQK